jgi:ABC-type sugar transport system ATPase subunit
VKPQAGQILFDGKTSQSLNLKIALELGIEMVHQHTLSLNPYFSIAENFALDSTPNYKLRSRKKNLAAAREFLAQID